MPDVDTGRRFDFIDLERSEIGRAVRSVLPKARISMAVPVSAGRVNSQYRIAPDCEPGEVVLRVYGRDAAACARETSLHARLPPELPTAELFGADPDGSVIGQPFTLWRWVPGTMLEELLAKDDETARQAAYECGRSPRHRDRPVRCSRAS